MRSTGTSSAVTSMVALIGSERPSVPVMQAMVLAVPITMQVPTQGARRPLTTSISSASNWPVRCALHSPWQSVQAPSTSPR